MRSLVVKESLSAYGSRLEKPVSLVKISPEALSFTLAQSGQVRRQRIQLQNTSSVTQRLRIEPPRSAHFKIDRELMYPKAPIFLIPGLDFHIDVEFQAPSQSDPSAPAAPSDYDDQIRVFIDGFQQPLHCKLTVRPLEVKIEGISLLDFGVLKAMGKSEPTTAPSTAKSDSGRVRSAGTAARNFDSLAAASRYLTLTNEGEKPVTLEVYHDPALAIRVTPARFTLSGTKDPSADREDCSKKIRVDLLPVKAGNFQAELVVREARARLGGTGLGSLTSVFLASSADISEALPKSAKTTGLTQDAKNVFKTIQLTATVLDRQLQLRSIDNAHELKGGELNFGSIYSGEEASIKARLVNRGASVARWAIVAKDKLKSKKSFEDLTVYEDPTVVIPQPAEGILQPFSDTVVEFAIRLKPEQEKTGFKAQEHKNLPKQYISRLQIQMAESVTTHTKDEPLDLQFRTRITKIAAKLNTELLRFPNLRDAEQNVKTITLTNGNAELPLAYSIDTIAHFKFEPIRGILLPGGSAPISVTFAPNQAGNFDKHIKVKLFGIASSSTIASLQFRVTGKCITEPKPRLSSAGRHQIVKQDFFHIHPNEDVDPQERQQVKEHQKRYDDLIRVGRKVHYIEKRRQALMGQHENEEQIDDKRATKEVLEEWAKIDLDNGLMPPEPEVMVLKTKFKIADAVQAPHSISHYHRKVVSLALENDVDIVQPSFSHADEKRVLYLFQRLVESSHALSKNAPLITVDGMGILQKLAPASPSETMHLHASELGNIYTPFARLDFGMVTNHSDSSTILCFLNATATKTPIRISVSGLKRTDQQLEQHDVLTVEPPVLTIPPLAIGIFRIHLQSHRSNTELLSSGGFIETKLDYVVNDKFKYSMPVVATMNPIQVELRGDALVENTVRFQVTPTKKNEETEFQGEKILQLVNLGSYQARFAWERLSRENREDGRVEISPSSGTIQPKSTLLVRVQLKPGLRARIEQQFCLKIFDPYFDTNESKQANALTPEKQQGIKFYDQGDVSSIVSTTNVRVYGEVSPTKFVILGMMEKLKTFPTIDFGCLPVSTTQFSAYSRTSPPKIHRFYSTKTIKIRNPGTKYAYFTSTNSNPHSELCVFPKSGVISPDGGVLELFVWVIPTRATDQPIKDSILVSISGSGRQITIPISYESHVPVVECTHNPKLEFGCAIGGMDQQEVVFKNVGNVSAKVLIDLRNFPQCEAILNSATLESEDLPTDRPRGRHIHVLSRQQTESGLKIKSGDTMFRRAKTGEDEDALEWFFRQPFHDKNHFSLDHLNSYDQKREAIYALELLPSQNASVLFAFRPKDVVSYEGSIPVYVLGLKQKEVAEDPLNLSIPLKANGFQSPLKVSRTEIHFRDKVLTGKDLSVSSSSRLSSRLSAPRQINTSRETIELSNPGDKPITWTLDPKGPQDIEGHGITDSSADSTLIDPTAFQFEQRSGLLMPGAVEKLSVTFNPTEVGRYAASFPVYTDVNEKTSHVVTLSFKANCVEPSLLFDPPEVFIPIVPPGEEVVVVFSLLSFGYDRNDVKYSFMEDLRILFGLSKQRNSALNADIEDKDHKKGSLKVLFPEGGQLKGDGEPLTVAIRFRAPQFSEISFTSRVCFEIQETGPFVNPSDRKILATSFLLFHATSDNSLLTLWPYMERKDWAPKASATVEKDPSLKYKTIITERLCNQDPSIIEISKKKQIMFVNKSFYSPSGFCLEPNSHAADRAYDHLSDVINRWLIEPFNLHTLSSDFPQNFIQSHGSLLVELVVYLTGKKIPVFSTTANFTMAHQNPAVRVNALHRQYSDVLNFLKTHGALLNTVRPEYLFSEEDYQRWMRAKLESMRTVEGKLQAVQDAFLAYQHKVERHFDKISREAWINVILQVAKIYIFDLIDSKNFKTLPGVNSREEQDLYSELLRDDAAKKESQMQNLAENLLLRWISYSSFRSNSGSHWKFAKDFSALQDGRMLASTILAHIPSGEAIAQLRKTLESDEKDPQMWELAIRRALSEIFVTTIDDFLTGSSNMMLNLETSRISFGKMELGSKYDTLMLSCFLFQGLPQFLGKATLEFSGSLHQNSVRRVEVSNSSQKTITYNVMLDAQKEFSMGTVETILDDDKKAMDVPVKMEKLGANAFTVMLPPKATLQVPIEFMARFARKSGGLLMFKSKNIALNNLSILLFELESKVTAVRPQKTDRVEVPIFTANPPTTVSIEVENPFAYAGEFTIHMKETFTAYRALSDRAAARLAPGGSQEALWSTKKPLPKIPSNSLLNMKHRSYPNAFQMREKKLNLGPKEKMTLHLTFIPFEIGTYDCVITLLDNSVGEFSHRIEGVATAPPISEQVKWVTKCHAPIKKAIGLQHQNLMREKAILASLFAYDKELRVTSVSSRRTAITSEDATRREIDRETFQFPKIPLRYAVSYSSAFYDGPSEVFISPPAEPRTRDKRFSMIPFEQKLSELVVAFNPKEPGKYPCTISLKGIDIPDYRVFQVMGIAATEGIKGELEFSVPARQTVTQEIPIANRSETDWFIKATLQQSGSLFSGPQTLVVKANQTGYYSVLFRPNKAGERAHATLNLVNSFTGQKYTYQLRGAAEDPLPEETIALTINARELTKRPLVIRDLAEKRDAELHTACSSPLLQFWIANDRARSVSIMNLSQNANYTEYAKPSKVDACFRAYASGTYTASVYVKSKTDYTVLSWYSFEVTVKSPPADDKIRVATVVRQAATVQIQLDNPLADNVDYEVTYQGRGLHGLNKVKVPGKKEITYELSYRPIFAESTIGSVRFFSPKVGEFWYELQLDAKDAPAIALSDMMAPLGRCAVHKITVSNPSDIFTQVNIDHNCKSNFRVVSGSTNVNNVMLQSRPESLSSTSLAPRGTLELQLLFWPSLEVSDVKKTTLTISSTEIGTYVYEVSGTRQILPKPQHKVIPMPELVVRSHKGKTSSNSLIFLNPFAETVSLTVSLRETTQRRSVKEGEELIPLVPVFQLMLSSSGRRERDRPNSMFAGSAPPASAGSTATAATLPGTPSMPAPLPVNKSAAGHEKVEIPVSFHPTTIGLHSAELVVDLVGPENLRWVYPVLGVADVLVSTNVICTLISSDTHAESMSPRMSRTKPPRNPFQTGGKTKLAGTLEANVGDSIQVFLDIPLNGFLAARKHYGLEESGSSALGGDAEGVAELPMDSNKVNISKLNQCLQYFVEFGDVEGLMEEAGGNSLVAAPANKGSTRQSTASLHPTQSHPRLAVQLDEDTFRVHFQTLLSSTHDAFKKNKLKKEEGGVPGLNPMSARFHVCFAPKDIMLVPVSIVITDDTTKARWTTPLRVRGVKN